MEIVARGQDAEVEGGYVSGPSGFALNATRHMYEFGTTKEMLSTVAEKTTIMGALTPMHTSKEPFLLKNIMKARMVTTPFGFHDVPLVTMQQQPLWSQPLIRQKTETVCDYQGFWHGGTTSTRGSKDAWSAFLLQSGLQKRPSLWPKSTVLILMCLNATLFYDHRDY